MRKSIVIAVSLLFVVASAFAQQHATPANTVSVFVSDATVSYSSSSGSNVDATFGAAFDHMFSRHVSAELSVTSQRVRRSVSTFGPAGQPVFTSFTDTLYPVDANVSYHFFTDSRWKPYVGGGVRYVSGTVRNFSQLNGDRVSTHSINPEISGGVMFQFRPTLGLRFDAKQVIGSNASIVGDAAFTGSVGLSFRF
jgi:outer membrane protein W